MGRSHAGQMLAALPTPAADALVETATALLVENKFLGLFALLFGIGTALQLARARARGASGLGLHLRRMLWLLAIGAVHGWLLWSYEVLRFYALWGLLLPLFDRLRARALLLAGLACAVAFPSAWRVLLLRGGAHPPALSRDPVAAAVLEALQEGGLGAFLAANWTWDWALTLSPTQGPYQLAVFGRMLLGLWLARRLLAPVRAGRRPGSGGAGVCLRGGAGGWTQNRQVAARVGVRGSQ